MICAMGDSGERDAGARWFDRYVRRLREESVSEEGAGPYACPCCGYLTLAARGGWEICAVCHWEDDGQDDHDADVVRGGPNGSLSLTEARRNFDVIGACDERSTHHVRPPRRREVPEDGSARPLPEVARGRRRKPRSS
jgi:hypothetical protein